MDGPLTALLRGEEDDGPQTAQELLLEKKYAEEEDALLLPRGTLDRARPSPEALAAAEAETGARKAAAARRAAELTRAEACYSGEPVSLRLEWVGEPLEIVAARAAVDGEALKVRH